MYPTFGGHLNCTMKNEIVPAKHNSHLKIDIANGLYNVTISQMFDPKDVDHKVEIIHFEIVFNSSSPTSAQKANKVFWWTE